MALTCVICSVVVRSRDNGRQHFGNVSVSGGLAWVSSGFTNLQVTFKEIPSAATSTAKYLVHPESTPDRMPCNWPGQ